MAFGPGFDSRRLHHKNDYLDYRILILPLRCQFYGLQKSDRPFLLALCCSHAASPLRTSDSEAATLKVEIVPLRHDHLTSPQTGIISDEGHEENPPIRATQQREPKLVLVLFHATPCLHARPLANTLLASIRVLNVMSTLPNFLKRHWRPTRGKEFDRSARALGVSIC